MTFVTIGMQCVVVVVVTMAAMMGISRVGAGDGENDIDTHAQWA